MKRGLIIIAIGLIAAAAAYGCVYFVCSSPTRDLQRSDKPELAWLKEEFHLSDAEFKHLSELHAAYLPKCQEMCRQIDAQNEQLEKLILTSTNVTPEIESSLAQAARLRAECQTMMLRHFIQVSQMMPPEQGRRYLVWVKEKAFLPDYGMNTQP